MNSNTLMIKQKLSNIIEHKGLSLSEIEKGAGIPRAALRNFLNGTVKDAKIEVIIAVAKFLEIDIGELLSSNVEDEPTLKKESTPLNNTALNKQLLMECVQSMTSYMSKKNITVTFDESLEIIRKIYNYSIQYTESKLDTSFLEWCLDSHSG